MRQPFLEDTESHRKEVKISLMGSKVWELIVNVAFSTFSAFLSAGPITQKKKRDSKCYFYQYRNVAIRRR